MYTSRYTKKFRIHEDVIVLYNTITSAIDVVDSDVLSEDEKLGTSGNEELLAYLSDRGYIYSSEQDELDLIQQLYTGYDRFKREIRPLIFYIVLTYRCDLACDYCFQSSAKALDGSIDTSHLSALFKAMDQIRERFPDTRSRPVVALFGGEPLLRQNVGLVKEIFREVAERGWVNGPIISNGVSLDAHLPTFERFRPSGIQVTIDGPEEIHNQRRHTNSYGGTFHTIVENINRAIEAGIKMGIRTNLDDRNIHCLPDLVDLAERQGWIDRETVELSLAPVHERACGGFQEDERHDIIFDQVLVAMSQLPKLKRWSLDGWSSVHHFQRLLHEGKAFIPRFDHCEAAVGKSFHLDGYGHIYSCIEACGMPELAAGRYVPELEFFPLYDEMRNRSVMNIEGCTHCGYSLVCGGGCALQAIFDKRELLTPSCANTDASIRRYVEFHYVK